MPVVSVILTSRNHEKYLREAIDSVLEQTFGDFEFFIMDDASTDGSWDIIQSYTDPRIKALRNGDIRRTATNLNEALEKADGKYVAIHCSDDVWESNKLQTQVAFLESNSHIGAVFTRVLGINEQGQPIPNHPYAQVFDQENRSRLDWLRHFFDNGNALSHPSVLIRKECFAKFPTYNQLLGSLGDLEMWVRLCTQYEIHVLPERLIRFRITDNQASAPNLETQIRVRHDFLRIIHHYRSLNIHDLRSVFPSLKEHDQLEEHDLDFLLATVCISADRPPYVKMFGLNILYELLSIPARSQAIKVRYGFTHKDFISLTGELDLFGVSLGLECVRLIDDCNRLYWDCKRLTSEREHLAAECKRLTDENAAIYSSTSWVVTKPIRFLRRALGNR